MSRLQNSYVLRFDKAPNGGTETQRNSISETVKEHVVFGSPLNRVMHGLAVLVKYHTHNVTIGFQPGIPFGTANQVSISINQDIEGDILVGTFWHELGHVIGMNFWSDSSEGWAHLFGGWIGNDNREHPAWIRLRDTLDAFNFDGSPPVT